MTTHDSIRSVLERVHAEVRSNQDADDQVRSFSDDVEKLISKLAQDDSTPKGSLFGDLMQLHGRCVGPLERFRSGIEEALSVVETLTQ